MRYWKLPFMFGVFVMISACEGAESPAALRFPVSGAAGSNEVRSSSRSRFQSGGQDSHRSDVFGRALKLRDEAMVRQRLASRGVSVSEAEVDAALNASAKNSGPNVAARVVSAGPTEKERRALVRTRIEIDRLIADDLTVPIKEEEIRMFYETNRARYVAQEAVVIREIFLAAADAKSRTARLAEMRFIVNSLEAGTSFAVLARRHSEAASAMRGGATGRLTRNQVPSSIWTALQGTLAGEHRLVETPEGLILIQLVAHVPGRTVSLEDARAEIAANLRARHRSDATANALAGLRVKGIESTSQLGVRKGLKKKPR